MSELLKIFGIVHLVKMNQGTAKTILDGAFKIALLFIGVWMVAILTIGYFALKLFNVF